MLTDPDFDLLHHAPAMVLVLAKSSDNQAIEDCCLAAENLMLAARDVGLGTCWIGLSRLWLNLASTKVELGIPEKYRIVAPIILLVGITFLRRRSGQVGKYDWSRWTTSLFGRPSSTSKRLCSASQTYRHLNI